MCIIPYNERKAKFLKDIVKIAKPKMDNYEKHRQRSFNYHYVNYTRIRVFMAAFSRILAYFAQCILKRSFSEKDFKKRVS